MAGIGEASAIIAIAQIGVKVSKTIFEYASEAKDAPNEISRIGRDLCTTSERLEEIGKLIDRNPATQLFNAGGIASAVRCSNDCKEIVDQVTGLLAKSGWTADPETLEKKDLDIGLIESLRWPLVRKKLASPQADLERVKASLSLLFNSVMANASSNPMQSHWALEIPKLQRWADQATRKAQNEKRELYQSANSGDRTGRRGVHWEDGREDDDDDESEMRQSFVEYRIRQIKQEEDRRIEERAAYNLARQEAQRKAEEDARKAIEKTAIEDYQREQEQMLAQRTKRLEIIRQDLVRIGLEEAKITSFLESKGLQDLDWQNPEKNQPERRASQAWRGSPNVENDTAESTKSTDSRQISSGSSRSKLRRMFHRPPKSVAKASDAANFDTSDDPYTSLTSATFPSRKTELWLLDLDSGDTIKLAAPHTYYSLKINESQNNEVLKKLARMQHAWRAAILSFMNSRNEAEHPHFTWQLCLISLPRRMPTLAIFGHHRGSCMIRLLIRQEQLAQATGQYQSPGLLKHSQQDLGKTLSKAQNRSVYSSLSQQLTQSAEGDRAQSMPANSEIRFDPNKLDPGTAYIKSELNYLDGNSICKEHTIIPADAVPLSAIGELGLPCSVFSPGADDSAIKFITIPRALTDEEISKLQTLVAAKMHKGEVPWKKWPAWRRETLSVEGLEKKNTDGRNAPTDDGKSAQFVDDGRPKLGSVASDLPRNQASDGIDGQTSTRRTIETEYIPISRPASRPPSTIRSEYAGPISVAGSQYDRGRDSETIEYSYDRPPRRWSSYYEDDYDDRFIVRERERETYSPSRSTGGIVRYRSRSPPRGRQWSSPSRFERRSDSDRPRYYYEESEIRRTQSPSREKSRPREEHRDQLIIRETERERLPPRPREEVYEEVIIRERERERLPPQPREVREEQEESRYVVPRASRYREEVATADDDHRGNSMALVRRRTDSGERSPPEYYSRHTSSRSRTPGPPSRTSTFLSDTDNKTNGQITIPFRPSSRPRSHKDQTEDRDTAISNILKKFTTFTDDVDREGPISPVLLSPPGILAGVPSSGRTLEEAETRLLELHKKKDEAERNGDLAQASDLQFYAIPDIKAQVEELRAKKQHADTKLKAEVQQKSVAQSDKETVVENPAIGPGSGDADTRRSSVIEHDAHVANTELFPIRRRITVEDVNTDEDTKVTTSSRSGLSKQKRGGSPASAPRNHAEFRIRDDSDVDEEFERHSPVSSASVDRKRRTVHAGLAGAAIAGLYERRERKKKEQGRERRKADSDTLYDERRGVGERRKEGRRLEVEENEEVFDEETERRLAELRRLEEKEIEEERKEAQQRKEERAKHALNSSRSRRGPERVNTATVEDWADDEKEGEAEEVFEEDPTNPLNGSLYDD